MPFINEKIIVSSTRFLSKAILPLLLSVSPFSPASASVPGIEHEASLNTPAPREPNAEPNSPVNQSTLIFPNEVISDSVKTTHFHQHQCETELLKQVDGVGFQYDAEIRSVSVQSERKITSTQSGLWQMHSKAHWLFLSIEETSVFMMPSWQLQNFEHKRKGMGNSKDLSIRVNHNDHSYISETAKKERTLTFQDELYDSLNYQLRLQLDVACNPARKNFHYPIAKKKGVRQYHFMRLGDERINTEIGEFDTVKLVKEENSGKRKTTVWLAKDLAYSVIKLDHTEDDQTDSLTISARPALNDLSQTISER